MGPGYGLAEDYGIAVLAIDGFGEGSLCGVAVSDGASVVSGQPAVCRRQLGRIDSVWEVKLGYGAAVVSAALGGFL